ncbi:MAG TPA: diguanylate cyclase, partial [Candidatus Omnitrophica bacterium]|nr:diguanylate cyclase [Candidatus Omnitrophota bacterium]
ILDLIKDMLKIGAEFVILTGSPRKYVDKHIVGERGQGVLKDIVVNETLINQYLHVFTNMGNHAYKYNLFNNKIRIIFEIGMPHTLRKETIRVLNAILEKLDMKSTFRDYEIEERTSQIVFWVWNEETTLRDFDNLVLHESEILKIEEFIEKAREELIIKGIDLEFKFDQAIGVIDILPRGANKSIGIKKITEIFQISGNSIIYIADSFGRFGSDSVTLGNVGLAINVGRHQVVDDSNAIFINTSIEDSIEATAQYLMLIRDLFTKFIDSKGESVDSPLNHEKVDILIDILNKNGTTRRSIPPSGLALENMEGAIKELSIMGVEVVQSLIDALGEIYESPDPNRIIDDRTYYVRGAIIKILINIEEVGISALNKYYKSSGSNIKFYINDILDFIDVRFSSHLIPLYISYLDEYIDAHGVIYMFSGFFEATRIVDILNSHAEPYGFLWMLKEYAERSHDKSAVFQLTVNPDRTLKTSAFPGLIMHDSGKSDSVNYRGQDCLGSSKGYFLRGTVQELISSKDGFVRLDPSAELMKLLAAGSEIDGDNLLYNIVSAVEILIEEVNSDKDLVILDLVKELFKRRYDIQIPEIVTLGGFLELLQNKGIISDSPLKVKAKVSDPLGIHNSTAIYIAKIVESYPNAKIYIRKRSKTADARKASKLVWLGVGPGEEVEIEVIGKNAKEAINELVAFIEKGKKKQKHDTKRSIKETKVKKASIIIRGIPVSPGVAEDVMAVYLETVRDLPKDEEKAYVIVRKYANNDTIDLFLKAVDRYKILGVVTAEGGATSHFAKIVIAAEMPYIAGVGDRAEELNGKIVTLDGTKGRIYITEEGSVKGNKSNSPVVEKSSSLLLNKEKFIAKFNRDVRKMLKDGKDMYLMTTDIDLFNKVNNLWDKDVGDILRDDICVIIDDILNKYKGSYAYWGGEETEIAIALDSKDKAEKLAEEIRRKIKIHLRYKYVSLSFYSLNWIRMKAERDYINLVGGVKEDWIIGLFMMHDNGFNIAGSPVEKMALSPISKVTKYIADLESGYEGARNSATQALAEIGEPAVEPLIEALKDNDNNVRNSVTQALGEIGDIRKSKSGDTILNSQDGSVSGTSVDSEEIRKKVSVPFYVVIASLALFLAQSFTPEIFGNWTPLLWVSFDLTVLGALVMMWLQIIVGLGFGENQNIFKKLKEVWITFKKQFPFVFLYWFLPGALSWYFLPDPSMYIVGNAIFYVFYIVWFQEIIRRVSVKANDKTQNSDSTDLKGPHAPEANLIIEHLIKEDKVVEIVYDEANNRLSSYKIDFIRGYIPGKTKYKGKDVAIDIFLNEKQQQSLLEWIKEHKIRGSPVKFRVILDEIFLNNPQDINHANIAHAGRQDKAIYIGKPS